MDLGLNGRIALVSGGSAGMGRAIARELAAEGVHVMIAARREGPLRETADAIAAAGGSVAWVSADMSRADDVGRAIRATRERFGDPDIVIWNVRSILRYSFDEASPDDFRESCDQIILHMVHVAKATAPAMKAKGWGRFVNIGSVCMKEPHRFYDMVLSNTFRTASLGLSRALSNEYAEFGVTVNTICPGSIATGLQEETQSGKGTSLPRREDPPRIQMGRDGTPEEISGIVTFLCSDRASYITGQALAVDGGWTRGLF